MSSLAAALAAQKPAGRGTICGVKLLLEKLDDIDKQALLNAIASDMYATDISRALFTENHEVSPHTITRHRKKDCNCDRG